MTCLENYSTLLSLVQNKNQSTKEDSEDVSKLYLFIEDWLKSPSLKMRLALYQPSNMEIDTALAGSV